MFVCPPEYRPKSHEEYQRIFKEADFAFRQAIAFCPYSPEAVFRYAQLLLQARRFDDARLVAETCLKLDPYNGQVKGLVDTIRGYQQSAGYEQAQITFQQLEEQVRQNPSNFQAALDLASAYLQLQQTNRTVQILEGILNHPQAGADVFRSLIPVYSSLGHYADLQRAVDKLEKQPQLDAAAVLSLAQAYAVLQNVPKLEQSLDALVKLMPTNPEAWYDLAALKCGLGKTAEALPALRQAVDLSQKRLQQDSKARDLLDTARKDERFRALRSSPEFQQVVPP